jgi:prolipoprotein diacylglyceryltransferase
MGYLLGIAFLAFWIWMIIDCANNETVDNNQRTIWILIIVLTFIIGAAIYYFTRKMPRDRMFE